MNTSTHNFSRRRALRAMVAMSLIPVVALMATPSRAHNCAMLELFIGDPRSQCKISDILSSSPCAITVSRISFVAYAAFSFDATRCPTMYRLKRSIITYA